MVALTRDGRPAPNGTAGMCKSCKDGHCSVCASDDCTCADRRKHTRRPSYGRVGVAHTNGNMSSSVRRLAAVNGESPAPALVEPHIELVRSDPPEKPKKVKPLSLVEKVRPLLEQLMAEDNHERHRIVLFAGAKRAAHNRSRLAAAYGEFKWEAFAIPEVDQSAIWVTWTGARKVLS